MNLLSKICLQLGYRISPPFSQVLAGRQPGVLLYHGVPEQTIQKGKYAFDANSFQQQVVCLKRHFDLIHPDDLRCARPLLARKAVLLTFDDGLQNNAVVAACILIKHRVPAIFFICNRHTGTDKVMWFVYLHMLEHGFTEPGFTFRDKFYDMSPPKRKQAIATLRQYLLQLRPHPGAMYSAIDDELPPLESFLSKRDIEDWSSGITEEQMAELDANPLFSVEAHTTDHPFLTKCTHEEAVRQIRENKVFIERVCNKTVTSISYPLGDYDEKIIASCDKMGFQTAYAVIPQVRKYPRFEIPRSGVYQPFKEVAAFKGMWATRRSNHG